jgi:hypothetical protein
VNKRGNWPHFLINAILLIALVAYLHFVIYVHEFGFFQIFNIPKEFTEVHSISLITDVLPVTFIIAIFLLVTAIFFTQVSRQTDNRILSLIFIFLPLILIVVWLSLIWQKNLLIWFAIGAFLLYWGGLYLLTPLFNKNSGRSYKERLYQQQINDAKDINAILKAIGWVKEYADGATKAKKDKETELSNLGNKISLPIEDKQKVTELLESTVNLAIECIKEGASFEDFAKELQESFEEIVMDSEAQSNMNDLLKWAWNEAKNNQNFPDYNSLPNEALSTLLKIKSLPMLCLEGEPLVHENYHYLKYCGKFYKVGKLPDANFKAEDVNQELYALVGPESKSENGKTIQKYMGLRCNSCTNQALDILIERDSKSEIEKQVSLYKVLLNSAKESVHMHTIVKEPIGTDTQFAQAWEIKKKPYIKYIWEIATGKRPEIDFDHLPTKIKSAIPTSFADASSQPKSKDVEKAVRPNSSTRRVFLVIFAVFTAALLAFLSYERGAYSAFNQNDFITFSRSSTAYVVYRIYGAHVICSRTLDFQKGPFQTFYKSDMQNIKSVHMYPSKINSFDLK